MGSVEREPGCRCTHEEGDSDCPVHPTCQNCGGDIEAALRDAEARTAEAIAAWLFDEYRVDWDGGALSDICDAIRSGAWKGDK